MIRVDHLYKSFQSRAVHSDVSLSVDAGQTLTIIGGSGTGKSVLLKQIVGLLKPDRGEIWVNGVEISRMPEEALQEVQKMIGYVFQEAALFDSMTVGENVAFGLINLTDFPKEKIRQIVREKLSWVGLPDTEHMDPAELSGGMKKRVGIARALALDPKILLYDEPTTGLDPVMSDVVSDLIVRLKHESHVTGIAVTHDMKSAYKISDRIAMLYEGKILQVGTPEEMRSSSHPIVRQFIAGDSRGPITTPKHA